MVLFPFSHECACCESSARGSLQFATHYVRSRIFNLHIKASSLAGHFMTGTAARNKKNKLRARSFGINPE